MTLLHEALTLPVDEAVWTLRSRFDAAAAALMDRHYSREAVGSPQVGGPGFVLVMVTPDERSVWISKRHDEGATSARALADGFLGFRCSAFRNEGDMIASVLIRQAMVLTESQWGTSPFGWMTYVDRTRIESDIPGYCFRRAGWKRDREFHHERLDRFTHPGGVA